MRHAKSSPGVAIRYATQGAGTEPVAENFVQASMPKVLLALLLLAPFAAAQSTPNSKLRCTENTLPTPMLWWPGSWPGRTPVGVHHTGPPNTRADR